MHICKNCGAEEPETRLAIFQNGSKKKVCVICCECNLPCEVVSESVAKALTQQGLKIETISANFSRFRKFLRESHKKKAKSKHVGVKRIERSDWNQWYRTEYSKSEEWRTVSGYVRARDMNTCQECGVKDEDLPFSLEVHHETYYHLNRFGFTSPSDCVLLCPSCHDKRQMSTDRDFDCVRYSYFSKSRHKEAPFLSSKKDIYEEIVQIKERAESLVDYLEKKAEEMP